MSKLKTHSGAKKRFKRLSSGRVKFRRAKRNHILTKYTAKVKRQARCPAQLDPSDAKLVARLLVGC